ncbi:hypothetical protein IAT40_005963 [Kwoniella sp. CBS 6097]
MHTPSLIPYVLAFLTLTIAFPFPLPKPAGGTTPNLANRETAAAPAAVADPEADGLSNGERLARGLPPKAPLKRFDASKTGALRPRQSGGGGHSGDTDFWLEVRNASTKAVIGMLSYDIGNGIIILPRSGGIPVVFTLRDHKPSNTPQTIWARNQYIDTIAPVVARDWTYPNETLAPNGRRSFVFGVGAQGEADAQGNPTNPNRSNVFIISQIPTPIPITKSIGFGYVNINPPGGYVNSLFFVDRSNRRVLRTSWDPKHANLGLDWDHDGVSLHAVPIA